MVSLPKRKELCFRELPIVNCETCTGQLFGGRKIHRWPNTHTFQNPKNLDHYLKRSVKGDIQTRWLNFYIHSTSCNNENDRILRQLRLILAAGRMLELMHIVCAVTLARQKNEKNNIAVCQVNIAFNIEPLSLQKLTKAERENRRSVTTATTTTTPTNTMLPLHTKTKKDEVI